MAKIRLNTQSIAGTLTNTEVANAAAIAYSKLALSGLIANSDLAGSIAYSNLSLSGAIANSDLAGSIAYSNLAISGAIANSDLAGSIAYSKLVLSGAIQETDLATAVGGMDWILDEVPAGTIDGTNAVFTVATAPNTYPQAYINGVKVQYVLATNNNTAIDTYFISSASATLFTIGAAPSTGDSLIVCYVI